jgi:hypothetical protein
MLVACRLAGLSALEAYYAGVGVRAQFGPTQRSRDKLVRRGRRQLQPALARCQALGGVFPDVERSYARCGCAAVQ